MTTAEWTAVLGLAFSGFMFYTLASRSRGSTLTVLGYTHADREVDHSRFGASLVASSTSLATVILFFLATASHYGYVLFWTGLTYIAGQGLFTWYVKDKSVLKRDLRTVSDLWFWTVRDQFLARLISVITVTSFLIILFVELYVGTIIVGYFLARYVPAGANLWAFLMLSVLVIGYVQIGGLRGVMQTDRWQLGLMLIAVAALLFHSILAPVSPAGTPRSSFWFTNVDFAGAILFCAWILMLNFTLPFSQLSSWQRVTAAKSGKEAWKGFRDHAIPFFLVWMVPIIAFMLLATKGHTYSDLGGLFDEMKSLGDVSEAVLFPLVVVGFGSALFSTADTAMIALGAALADRNTFLSRLEKHQDAQLRRIFTWFAFAVMVALAGVFALAEAGLGAWFLPLIYAIFGQLAIVSPLAMYGLLKADATPLHMGAGGRLLIAAGLFVGWGVVLGAVFVDQSQGTQIWSQAATIAGFAITGGALLLALRFFETRVLPADTLGAEPEAAQ